jgi:RNA polymerase sigma-B factor
MSSPAFISAAARDGRREHRLFRQRDRDPRARSELIESKLRLAESLAQRYAGAHTETEDLRQAAAAGLVKAVDRFDPELGAAFTSFADPTNTGHIRRHIRDPRWVAHVTRDLQEAALAVRAAVDELTPALGRAPSIAEIARAAGCSAERVTEGLAAARALDAESLDAPTPGGDVDRYEMTGVYDERLESANDRETARSVVARLPSAQRDLLKLRFEDGLTQRQIGERMGISQMHVSRLLKAALERASILAAA